MIHLPKDLQKQNFYEGMQKMLSFSGWEILEETRLLALKSPARLPFANFVWGETTPENLQKAKSFFLFILFTGY